MRMSEPQDSEPRPLLGPTKCYSSTNALFYPPMTRQVDLRAGARPLPPLRADVPPRNRHGSVEERRHRVREAGHGDRRHHFLHPRGPTRQPDVR